MEKNKKNKKYATAKDPGNHDNPRGHHNRLLDPAFLELMSPFIDLRTLINLYVTNSQYYAFMQSRLNRHYFISRSIAENQYHNFSESLTSNLPTLETIRALPPLEQPNFIEYLDRKILELLDFFRVDSQFKACAFIFSLYFLYQLSFVFFSASSLPDEVKTYGVLFDIILLHPLLILYSAHLYTEIEYLAEIPTHIPFFWFEILVDTVSILIAMEGIDLLPNEQPYLFCWQWAISLLSNVWGLSCILLFCECLPRLRIPESFWTRPPEDCSSLSLAQLDTFTRQSFLIANARHKIYQLIYPLCDSREYLFRRISNIENITKIIKINNSNAIFLDAHKLYHYDFLLNHLTKITDYEETEEINDEKYDEKELAIEQLKKPYLYPGHTSSYNNRIRHATGYAVFKEDEYFDMPCSKLTETLNQHMHFFYFAQNGRKSADHFIKSIYKNAETPGCGLIHASFDPMLLADHSFSESNNQDAVILYQKRLYYFDHLDASVCFLDQNEEKNEEIEYTLDSLKMLLYDLEVDTYHRAIPKILQLIQEVREHSNGFAPLNFQ